MQAPTTARTAADLLDAPTAAAAAPPPIRVVKLVRRRRTRGGRRAGPVARAGEALPAALWIGSSASLLWHLPAWPSITAAAFCSLVLCSPRPRAEPRDAP